MSITEGIPSRGGASSSNRGLRLLTGALLLVAGVVVSVLGIRPVFWGVDIALTTVRGYNDSVPALYLSVGGIYALFGALVFFTGILLVRMSIDQLSRQAVTFGRFRHSALFAIGITLGMLALAAIGWGLVANLATPDETAGAGAVATTTTLATVATVLLAASSVAVMRRYFTTAPSP